MVKHIQKALLRMRREYRNPSLHTYWKFITKESDVRMAHVDLFTPFIWYVPGVYKEIDSIPFVFVVLYSAQYFAKCQLKNKAIYLHFK